MFVIQYEARAEMPTTMSNGGISDEKCLNKDMSFSLISMILLIDFYKKYINKGDFVRENDPFDCKY